MEDSDVGKIWASVLAGMKSPEDAEVVKGLIRKLVEERINRLESGYTYMTGRGSDALSQTLRDFNIDPATWTKD